MKSTSAISRALGFAVIPLLADTALAAATGWSGGEPATYTTSLYVDSSFIGTETGSSTAPFNTVTEGINALNTELSAGRTVRLLIKSGLYRESLPSVSAGQNSSDRSQNSNITRQDTWMRIDRWGDSGEVIIDGTADWSSGQGEGGEWTPVPGQPGLYSRNWTRNWGLWGGGRGSANVSVTEGQRREMVFVDYGDGQGRRRLRQVALEQYSHTRPTDNGNSSSWNGPGVWTYSGYAGLGSLSEGTFGVTELSTESADAATTPNTDMTSYQQGVLITTNGTSTIKRTFKQVYDLATNKAPAEETNKIYIKLPASANIASVRIDMAVREQAFIVEKRNYVLANLTFRGFTNRMFGSGALEIGRSSYNWYLTNGNALLENITVRDVNSNGMNMAGMMNTTFRNCRFDSNGATGLNPAYVFNFKLENCVFANTGWRAHDLGRRFSFIPGAMKTWNTVGLQLDDCRFEGNLYKGFYSDNDHKLLTFNRTTFVRNVIGTMHEIARGPITYNQCRFEENSQGLANIQSGRIAVDGCDFVNNDFAIVPEAKSRQTIDLPTTYTWGDSMLKNTEFPVDVDEFSLTNSRLHSNRPGARLIAQGSQFSSESDYLREIRDEAVYANNRYYLSDHTYPFENDTEYSTFATWVAATGETGAAWDATLLTGSYAPTAPRYDVGFVWKRSLDFGRRTGGESGVGRHVLDAKGTIAWYHGVTHGRVGGTTTSTTPWFATPLDYLSLAKNGFIYKNEMESWPQASSTQLGTYSWTQTWNSSGAPMAIWRNPTGRPVTIDITGPLTVVWSGSAAQSASVAIAILRASGTYEMLYGAEVNRPSDSAPVILTPTGVTGLQLAAGDRILTSARVGGGGGSGLNVRLTDDLTFTLRAIEYPEDPPPVVPIPVTLASYDFEGQAEPVARSFSAVSKDNDALTAATDLSLSTPIQSGGSGNLTGIYDDTTNYGRTGTGDHVGGLIVNTSSVTSTLDVMKYAEFTVSTAANRRLFLTSLAFDYRRSNNQDTYTVHVRSSADNFASDVATVVAPADATWATASVDLSATAFQNRDSLTFRLHFTDSSGSANRQHRIDNLVLTGYSMPQTEPPALTYASWIGGYDGTLGQLAFSDNPDGDATPNGLEALFGTHPGVAGQPGIVLIPVSPGTLTLRHLLALEIPADMDWAYEWSTDFQTWHGDGATVNGVTVSFSDPATVGSLPESHIVESAVTLSGTPIPTKLFVRIRGTLQ